MMVRGVKRLRFCGLVELVFSTVDSKVLKHNKDRNQLTKGIYNIFNFTP